MKADNPTYRFLYLIWSRGVTGSFEVADAPLTDTGFCPAEALQYAIGINGNAIDADHFWPLYYWAVKRFRDVFSPDQLMTLLCYFLAFCPQSQPLVFYYQRWEQVLNYLAFWQ